jgi:hypothetical protein
MQEGARRYLLKDIDTRRLITEIEAVAREAVPSLPMIASGDGPAGKARLH